MCVIRKGWGDRGRRGFGSGRNVGEKVCGSGRGVGGQLLYRVIGVSAGFREPREKPWREEYGNSGRRWVVEEDPDRPPNRSLRLTPGPRSGA